VEVTSRAAVGLIAGLLVIVLSIAALLIISYQPAERQIGAFVQFRALQSCTISDLKIAPPSVIDEFGWPDVQIWVSSDCRSYRLEASRRIDVSSVNGGYEISEVGVMQNSFDTWKYDVRPKSDREGVPLIVHMKNVATPGSFASWNVEVSVEPSTVHTTTWGREQISVRNVILNEGSREKRIAITFVDMRWERLEQILVIVLSALIGVGAAAVFDVLLKPR
jgi:hypothetical protein